MRCNAKQVREESEGGASLVDGGHLHDAEELLNVNHAVVVLIAIGMRECMYRHRQI